VKASHERVPRHLRQYVARQATGEYGAADHAVWRFVLRQLAHQASPAFHEAYARGLRAAGMSTERIPDISHMDALLSRVGFGAVCVDGFIPPRAFQEFQALGLLPISANIRTREHLAYTPAPDIIHEAAGHAPILPEPQYAAFVRGLGASGAKAFALPADRAAYEAIYALSEVKEDPGATFEQVRLAEVRLSELQQRSAPVSEATRLARLYWWTAEYGLLGAPEQYCLYGAGLLSSLGESHSCHAPSVRKLWLSEGCLDVPFDITRPQPQLFVARDFEHLQEVLAGVDARMLHSLGGPGALEAACHSAEPATLRFAEQRELAGVVANFRLAQDQACWLELHGPLALSESSVRVGSWGAEGLSVGQPVGHLQGGGALWGWSEEEFERRWVGAAGQVCWRWPGGVFCEGRLAGVSLSSQGEVLAAKLSDYRLWVDGVLVEQGPLRELLLLPPFVTAQAGSVHAELFGETDAPPLSIPRPRDFHPKERGLRELYEQAEQVASATWGPEAVSCLERLHRCLERDFADEWLLRHRLLELLTEHTSADPLRARLWAELAALEVRFHHREPIASGLRQLGSLVA
jgi:phenylalanine-4-hydroxylase